MSNYNKKSNFVKVNLTSSQLEFINKVHNRYLNTNFWKRDLFDVWDRSFKVDGKIFKSFDHYENVRNRVLDCGNFTEYKVSTIDDRIKLVRANFCKKDKLCMSCAVGRAYNQQKKFLQVLKVYPYEYDDDLLSKYWYYIVTPVRHSKEDKFEVVYERVDKLRKSALMQIRNSRRGKSKGFWSQFNGGMGSIEITYNNNGWNIHINWLVNSDEPILDGIYRVLDKDGKEWYQNSHLEAFLRRFNNSHIHSINELNFTSREAIKKNLLEVLKYALKFSSFHPAQLIEVYYKLYRKRLFFTFGNLRGLDLEAVDDVTIGDDIQDYEDFVRLVYRRVNNGEYEFLFSY